MQKAKAFLFVSAGIFLIALTYHLGATSATAQATKSQVVAAYWSETLRNPNGADYAGNVVVTANGDVYFNASSLTGGWQKVGNAITP